MKLKNIYRFQEGGPMPEDPAMAGPAPEEAGMAPEAGAPAPGGEEQMMAQVGQMAQEIINQLGPDVAAMLAQAIMEMLQGGGGMPAPEEQPVYQRNGGRMQRIR